MTSKLVAFIVACNLWHNFLVSAGVHSCVDEKRFKAQVFQRGERGPHQLDCPLESGLLQTSPQLTWLKDCSPLPWGSPSSPARVILSQKSRAFLEFPSLSPKDQGNYTCMLKDNLKAAFTVQLTIEEPLCTKAPEFKPSGGLSELWETLGSTVSLNCTALLGWDPKEPQCETNLLWRKDGSPVSNHSLNTSMWNPSKSQRMVSSLLVVHLRVQADYGLYSCEVRNISADFSLQNTIHPSHTASVIAAVTLLALLTIAAMVYSGCRLNLKLWYKNSYGDYELNDGKMYDAYISYVSNDYDRKFVNFILKPHLENKYGHKLHLNDNDILPGSEPSAELLMNVSHCRRLIVVLSHAYLEHDWCSNNFRQGLLHLLELSQRLIFIVMAGQPKHMNLEITHQLRQHQHRLTVLTWGHHSMTPSSVFWKELALAMPRKVVYHSDSAGDPQTMLQDDKDPMLTLNPDYLDCRPDPDPAGDLGLRLPVYKALTSSRAPVLPADTAPVAELKSSEIDISDLGARNYGARTDFYCLVTKEDI